MPPAQTTDAVWPLLRYLPMVAAAFAIIAKGLMDWANGKRPIGGTDESGDSDDWWFGGHHGDASHGSHDGGDDGGGGDGGH